VVPSLAAGTVVGEFPWTVAAVLAGTSMRELSLSGVETAGPVLVIGGVLAATVLLSGPAYRPWRERRGPDASPIE
jgi:uncharacterized membrane protein YdjX (TVP38/TMEM64 family)